MTEGRKWIPRIVGILMLAACFGVGAFLRYQNRFAFVGGNRHEKTIESIDLSGQMIDDLTQLQAFPQLKQIDLRGTGLTCEAYEQVKSWFPEAVIFWDIPFQGAYYAPETDSLEITSLSGEDLELLPYFTELKSISADHCPDYKMLHSLQQQRPDLEITYRVPVDGKLYSHDVTELTLSGENVEALFEVLPCLTALEHVKLLTPLAPADRIAALVETFPEVSFSWELELAGIPVNEKTETLDLTGIPVTVAEMDAVLPYLLNLTYVDMTDCGISNEEMDALNRRYENIKIVWTVKLAGWYRVRTDITWFMPAKYGFAPQGTDLYNLRYCTDVVALDVGHMKISDIDFVAFMPHLKYLLLCQAHIRDLTPLTGLDELVYLELFMTSPQDLSPLVTLTALEDLNLNYVSGDPQIIARMTWLKNLWWNHWSGYQLTDDQKQMLRDAIPGCHFEFDSGSSTGKGWRELPNYYAQRDIFGMPYMFD